MKTLAILLLLLPLSVCWAADPLAEISARLLKTEITDGHFDQQKTLKFLTKPLLSSGTFTYHRRHGVIWRTLAPVSSTLLVNQQRLLTAHGEQVLPPAFGRVFTALFGGDLQVLREGFEIGGSNGNPAWMLHLQPKDAQLKKLITAIHLRGDRELHAIDIQEANGSSTRITFEHISHPETLTAAQVAEFERLSSTR